MNKSESLLGAVKEYCLLFLDQLIYWSPAVTLLAMILIVLLAIGAGIGFSISLIL